MQPATPKGSVLTLALFLTPIGWNPPKARFAPRFAGVLRCGVQEEETARGPRPTCVSAVRPVFHYSPRIKCRAAGRRAAP